MNVGQAGYFPIRPGDIGTEPEGPQLVVPIPRGVFPNNGMKTRWDEPSRGARADEQCTFFNAVLTCAMIHNLYTVLQCIYSEELLTFERKYPGVHPEDTHCLGFALHITGSFSDLVAFAAELQSLTEKATVALTSLKRNEPRPSRGSLMGLTTTKVRAPFPNSRYACLTRRQIWQAIRFCQPGSRYEAPFIDVMFSAATFDEWVCSAPIHLRASLTLP